MIVDEGRGFFKHYGTPRRSGRYPWGSGGNEASSSTSTPQDYLSLMDYIKRMLGLGMTESQIAEGLGMSTTELRAQKTILRNEQKAADIARAQRLKDKGLSNVEIGKMMGKNESSVRDLLNPGAKMKSDQLTVISNLLRDEVGESNFIDIGVGVERDLGISKERLATAVAMLKAEGYAVQTVKVNQLGTDLQTTVKVLAPPGTTRGDVYRDLGNIKLINEFSVDTGNTFYGIKPPLNIDSSRIAVRYAEDGGTEADGVIYVRPGVKDLSLGGSDYVQGRIAVDGTHYLKGMVMYKDDLPDGVDVLFNTNKSDTGNKLDAMKKLESDPDNPFKSIIKRQIIELDSSGNEVVTSAVNILKEEGDWAKESKTLSSQMLSKQNRVFAKRQLDLMYDSKRDEYEEIMALTNPVVKKKLLQEFADSADAASVHLKAAAMPRQATHVILPVESMKETEIFAPNYKNGEHVVLIRHPHGGIFEIPELVVNNNHPEAKKLLGRQATDAVGISAKVAERLSGADYDGDTVLVIPNNRGDIRTAPALKGLVGFDPKAQYPKYPGMKVMSEDHKQKEMGKVSNLITDMTIMGAGQDEIARAVRHSMVVIDAAKHELNYKQSYADNGIAALNKKYLGKTSGGAATIVSRAKSPMVLDERKLRLPRDGGPIDPDTGKLVYVPSGRTRFNKDTGKQEIVKKKYKSLAVVDDAFDLVSDPGTPIEKVYATHSNRLKDLANTARKDMLAIKNTPYSPSAKKVYATEVAEINAALNVALKNAPLERRAQIVANQIYRAKKAANPDMDKKEAKKIKYQSLAEARARMQAGKDRIELTDRQWEAIQAGAISPSKLKEVIDNSKPERIRELATPRSRPLMTSTKIQRAKNMQNAGLTQAEIADALGVSLTTLKDSLKGGS